MENTFSKENTISYNEELQEIFKKILCYNLSDIKEEGRREGGKEGRNKGTNEGRCVGECSHSTCILFSKYRCRTVVLSDSYPRLIMIEDYNDRGPV